MKHRIVDENGKTFDVSLSDISDMTTDSSDINFTLEDSDKFSMKDFQCKIYNEDGEELIASDIIADIKDNNDNKRPYAIDVLFEATHSGVNRNSWNYRSDSMEKDVASWSNPFKKPLLKNHDMSSEPVGRVIDAYHGKSELNDERDCINVLFRVTDADAMDKFLDGRYRTLSIGGSVKNVNCSVCGKDILKDGVFKFCGHWRGEVYNGQKAIWNGTDIEYKEGSIVNNPADDWAQVKKITLIKSSDSNKDSEESVSTEVSDNTKEDNIYDEIDNLIIVDNQDQNSEEITVDNDDTATDDTTSDDTTSDDTVSDDTVSDDNSVENIEDLKQEMQNKEAIITELNDKITELNDKIVELNDKISNIEEENVIVKDELTASRNKLIKLSIEHKNILAKRIADSLVNSNEITAEDYVSKCDELVKKSAKELITLNDEIKVELNPVKKAEDKVTTTVAQVQSPVIVNIGDSNSINDEEDENVPNNKLKNQDSYIDLEKSIINSIYR